MNQDLDERLIPEGDYIDAMNVRVGSTESSGKMGSLEKTFGNTQLTNLYRDEPSLGLFLSQSAVCIGAYKDEFRNLIFWFITDITLTYKTDLVVSYSEMTGDIKYHVIDIDSSAPFATVLNFNPEYPIYGVDMIDNLLFWTDNYNPPKKLNINKLYRNKPSASTFDLSENRLDVIVAPPGNAPVISPANIISFNSSQFVSERFLSFAYRYKYEEGNYSALSSFSDLAFSPKYFSLNTGEYLNDGMVNNYQNYNININSGGRWVTQVDLCVKDSDSNEISIVKSFNKQDLQIGNNAQISHLFDGDKSFSLLPSTEIVRLYDNVPLKSLAQCILGGRLFYGNYTEGYNMVDAAGAPVNICYNASLVTNPAINTSLSLTRSSYSYPSNWDGASAPATTQNSAQATTASFPLGFNLFKGVTIDFAFALQSGQLNGTVGALTPSVAPITLYFSFNCQRNYNSLQDLVSSQEFKATIGTKQLYYQFPIPTNNCNGSSLTDRFVCAIQDRNSYTRNMIGGIQFAHDGFSVVADNTQRTLRFIVPVMRYVTGASTYAYEYFFFVENSMIFNIYYPTSYKTLHSNRDYEVGMVYMDNFNRSSTVQISSGINNVSVGPDLSDNSNYIQATIPVLQKPPYWATRYRFVLRPSHTSYDTIYATQYYQEPSDQSVWIRLDGESANKVEVGDELIVKRDSLGSLNSLVIARVLHKESKPENFLSTTVAGQQIVELPGVYIKTVPTGWNANYIPSQFKNTGKLSASAQAQFAGNTPNQYAAINIPLYDTISGGGYKRWEVSAGAVVDIYIWVFRFGRGCSGGNPSPCGQQSSLLQLRIVSSKYYSNFKKFWEGESIQVANAIHDDGGCPSVSGHPDDLYNSLPFITTTSLPFLPVTSGINKYQFAFEDINDTNNDSKPMWLSIRSGIQKCEGFNPKDSRIEAFITIQNNFNYLVFETRAKKTVPNIFYENEQTFNITNGFHTGNVQNQSASLPAIINLNFYDCWGFGNGVESYKIKDSIKGRSLTIGQRVRAYSETPYKEEARISDITYSGVYNIETNINKLNEFNLGLFNFKPLERSYGSIQKMHISGTDFMVFQEDRISKLLVGKNIISDSTGGGVLSTVPEVLGNQIVFEQEYGISTHPSSFASNGGDMYFTDVKRGVVIKMQNGQMNPISDIGMRSYFRDLFRKMDQRFVIGQYDPYSKEYVLHVEDPPSTIYKTIDCGTNNTYRLSNATKYVITVNIGGRGSFISTGIRWNASLGVTTGFVQAKGYYNGVEVFSVAMDFNTNAAFNFSRTTTTPTYTIELTLVTGEPMIDISPFCPTNPIVTMTCISIASPDFLNRGRSFAFNQSAVNTPDIYSSSHYVNEGNEIPVTFTEYFPTINNASNQWVSIPVEKGLGAFIDQQVRMYAVQKGNVDINVNRPILRVLYTNTAYTQSNIATIITLSTIVTGSLLTANSPYAPLNGIVGTNSIGASNLAYLYLIWDYRIRNNVAGLCNESTFDASCCNCYTTAQQLCSSCSEVEASGVFLTVQAAMSAQIIMTLYSSNGTNVGSRFFYDAGCSFPAYEGFYRTTSTAGVQVNSSGFVVATIPYAL